MQHKLVGRKQLAVNLSAVNLWGVNQWVSTVAVTKPVGVHGWGECHMSPRLMVGFYHLTWCPDLLDHYSHVLVGEGNWWEKRVGVHGRSGWVSTVAPLRRTRVLLPQRQLLIC